MPSKGPLGEDPRGSPHALQLVAQHNSGLLNFQSKYALSQAGPHLHMKCSVESGDWCAQLAVSQLPSLLRNASLFPKAVEAPARRRREYVPVLEAQTWNHIPGPCVWVDPDSYCDEQF